MGDQQCDEPEASGGTTMRYVRSELCTEGSCDAVEEKHDFLIVNEFLIHPLATQ
jgi:hypothetical protein